MMKATVEQRASIRLILSLTEQRLLQAQQQSEPQSPLHQQ